MKGLFVVLCLVFFLTEGHAPKDIKMIKHRHVEMQNTVWPNVTGIDDVISGYVNYTMGNDTKVYQGFVAYPNNIAGSLPGVLVAHAWLGLKEMEEFRAKEMATYGFVAFALDYYGLEGRPTGFGDAPGILNGLKADVAEYHARMLRGVEVLKEMDTHFPGCNPVDSSALVAQGYCSGGQAVMELARIGADVLAVAAYHPSLANLSSTDAEITSFVSVHHAALDSQDQTVVDAFEAEMNDRDHTRYSIQTYADCQHGWTDPSGQSYRAPEAAAAHTAGRAALFDALSVADQGRDSKNEDDEDVVIAVSVVSILIFAFVIFFLFRCFRKSDESQPSLEVA